MKILIIYNPLAGKKNKKDKQIKNLLKNFNVQATWHYTTEGSFTHLNPNDYQRIFAAGGDGTIKEVASWLVDGHYHTPLAILPVGSANVLAMTLGVPLDIKNALKLGLTDKIYKIDVGLINYHHYFLIAAGCGFDAKVIKNASHKLKRMWGFLAYVVSLIFSFFNTKANKFFIKIDEHAKTVTAQNIFISNFAQFFNLNLNPEAQINDGTLNVSILKSLHINDLRILIPRFLKGKHEKDWRYEYYTAKEIYVLPFVKRTPIQIDGEVVDLPYLNVTILPQALNIIANKML
jgi:diacylglycerol kinase (ATP)